MTEIELIKDTIEYYKTHPRAIGENSQCEYLNDKGQMCAVGRFIDWEKVSKDNLAPSDINNNFGSIDGDNGGEILGYIKDELKHIPEDLWIELQTYHDYKLVNEDLKKEWEEKLLSKWSKN